MPEIEQARFKALVYADDRLLEELEAAEDDLIDDFLNGDLSPDHRVAFERYFLRSPEHRRRLDFGRSFKAYLSPAQPGDWQVTQHRAQSLLRSFFPYLRKKLSDLSIRPKRRN
jgi:hypothetical protein